MKIISDFKIKDPERINRLAKVGDVVLCWNVKYIRTQTGYISEFGYNRPAFEVLPKRTVVIKREQGDLLEDLLTEAEKRCYYAYINQRRS